MLIYDFNHISCLIHLAILALIKNEPLLDIHK
jgi:hypothetical protein